MLGGLDLPPAEDAEGGGAQMQLWPWRRQSIISQFLHGEKSVVEDNNGREKVLGLAAWPSFFHHSPRDRRNRGTTVLGE
jgi:hypothetical protein